ncbi:PaaX family transcriptional regulator [Ornithinimicrobium avium]|uniref:PaaX family transcriptional regulator n=1 Tax=Ornithinimicrobium avium TaxID=2283195 RepID=A0A345NNK3_9MICO|nr:PaaX family transcriptional regulator [Ornithinimicrobium avium]
MTIYGLYAREVGGWLSVSSLIRLMAELGVDEQAVRSSISRLKRRGILESERIDGRAGYALSAHAREILAAGDRRIFRRRRGTLDEGWVLAVFSVPESERRRRHTLRSRLSWLGFGSVGPGVWIAPAHLSAEARDVLLREELAEYVDLFEGRYLGFATAPEQVARWWDLESLDALYAQFCSDHEPVLARWRASRGKDETGMAFADYVRVLTAWRRLPYLDPGLAPELLPRDWSGSRAADLFFALRRRLEEPSHRFVEGVRQ